MDMQNVSNLQIPEGAVRTIHDKNNRLLWGRVAYDTKYAGDTFQQTYSGKNLYPGSQDFSGTWYRQNEWTTETDKYNGLTVKSRKAAWGGTYKTISVEAGKTYTFSVYAKASANRRADIYLVNAGEATAVVSPSSLTNRNLTTSWQRFSITFTVTTSGIICPRLENNSNEDSYTYICGYQLEESSSMTGYEPYTGGIPAPNPAYPQDIDVVTGTQAVDVHGKNIANIGSYDISGTNYTLEANYGNIKLASTTTNNAFDLNAGTRVGNWLPTYEQANDYHLTGLGGTYTVSVQNFINRSTGSGNLILQPYTNKRTNGQSISYSATSVTPITINLDSDEYIKSIYIWTPSGATIDMEMDIQLELGSTATTYESYQSQSYTIDLGATELCKIGDYQDYIYNSGDDWYVHKEVTKIVYDGEGEAWLITGDGTMRIALSPDAVRGSSSNNPIMSTQYVSRFSNSINNSIFLSGVESQLGIVDNVNAVGYPEWKSWLNANNLTVYYALGTPTDTKITDATLISQLDAVHEWLTRYGYNAIVAGNLPIVLQRDSLQ